MAFDFPYTSYDLTEEVNAIPNAYGYLNALDLFPSEPIASTNVRIEYVNGLINVLPNAPRGTMGQAQKKQSENGWILEIPHFPLFDNIDVQDIASVLAVQSGELRTRSLATVTLRKLAAIRSSHAITREKIRLGALTGTIIDGDGETLYDLYTVFGVTPTVVDWELSVATTNLADKAAATINAIGEGLKGETMQAVEQIVDTSFFNALVGHANFEKYYLNADSNQIVTNMERTRLGGTWGRLVNFQNILFREYMGSMPLADGSMSPNVAADSGTAYPAGTMNMFRTFDAPANALTTANVAPAEGDEVWVSVKDEDHDQGVELFSQSNALAVCKQLGALVQAVAG